MKKLREVVVGGTHVLRTNLVVLDGPRCSGKSSTGQLLVEKLVKLGVTAEYFKKGPPDPVDEATNMDIHLQNWWDRIDGGVDVVVVDRFVATELVMALYTGRVHPEAALSYCMRVASKTMTDFSAINLVLLPPLSALESRMEQRPADHRWDMAPERVHPLWMMAARLLPGVTLSTGTITVERQVDSIMTSLLVPYRSGRRLS